MGLIGQNCTHRKVFRRLVLIDQNKHTLTPKREVLTTQTRIKTQFTLPVFASTTQYLTQHPRPECLGCLSVANSSRETPGPIPNPEAKPARADGTATGRLWESKKPPTPNNKNNSIDNKRRGPLKHHHFNGPPFFHVFPPHYQTKPQP